MNDRDTDRARQLAFEFAPQPRFGEEDFLVSPSNEAAFALVMSWPEWPDPALLLIAPAGGGKSHLASIWARRAQAVIAPPDQVRADASLGALYGRNILLEDAEEVGDARGLFHLFNLVQESGASLLITASSPPETWGLRLPDLVSRLRRAARATIEPPDEELVRAVLVKLFADRQLAVEESLVDYMALRIGRSLDDARALVRALDEQALAQGRKITRAMAAEMIERLSRSD